MLSPAARGVRAAPPPVPPPRLAKNRTARSTRTPTMPPPPMARPRPRPPPPPPARTPPSTPPRPPRPPPIPPSPLPAPRSSSIWPVSSPASSRNFIESPSSSIAASLAYPGSSVDQPEPGTRLGGPGPRPPRWYGTMTGACRWTPLGSAPWRGGIRGCDPRCVQPSSWGWSVGVSRGLVSSAIDVSER